MSPAEIARTIQTHLAMTELENAPKRSCAGQGPPGLRPAHLGRTALLLAPVYVHHTARRFGDEEPASKHGTC